MTVKTCKKFPHFNIYKNRQITIATCHRSSATVGGLKIEGKLNEKVDIPKLHSKQSKKLNKKKIIYLQNLTLK